ncbi:putative MscS family protein YkuT [Gemmata obscuriglobus]|uniref:Mechanosensitive ion channel MscS domain-containing protein n=1 Tax=Gemmata obscuriglobus TaxID=114 RepID=A0A2Z3HCC4_9BACT
MLPTRIRLAAPLLIAAVCLSAGAGRSNDQKNAPPKPDPAQGRKAFGDQLTGRTADELKPLAERLAQEWVGHKGAVDVAHGRLTLRVADATKARQQVTDLKPPAPGPLSLQPDDAAIKAEQARGDYLTARVRALEAVHSALLAVGGAGAEFDRVAQAADDLLFRLKATATAAVKAGAGDLPNAIAPQQLDAAAAQLKTRTQEAKTATEKAKSDLGALEKELADARAAVTGSAAKVEALKGAQTDATATAQYESQIRLMNPQRLADEIAGLRQVLAEKTAAAVGDARDFHADRAAVRDARAVVAWVKEPLPPAGAAPFDTTTPLPKAVEKLTAAQQYMAARLRTADERADKEKALAAALDELEKKTVAYATTLDAARRAVTRLGLISTEIGRRVAAGDLDPAKAPDASTSVGRAALESDAHEAAQALAELRQERDALRKPDADADNVKNLTAQLHARVSERLALLNELQKLGTDLALAYKDRTEAEQKRLDQRAAERLAREAGEWDWALAFDRSKPALGAAELLAAYYRELVDADERADNLKRQREVIDQLVDLTTREAADAAKLRAVLARRANATAETRGWDEWLSGQLTPNGLRAEAATYQNEAARLSAVAAAAARRVEALTGNAAPEPAKFAQQSKLPAGGGEIGRARAELQDARLRGLRATGIKVGLILLGALILPAVVLLTLRRGMRGGTDAAGNPSPVLAVLRRGVRAATWGAAVALTLSVLGYDVTALVIALAIGALAVALAARPMIADVLGSVVIFAERRFQVGDVVRLGDIEAARVVDITWRSTALKTSSGLVFSVPNRKVTESALENLSKGTETYDTLAVTVSTDKDAGKVIGVIRAAVGQCKNVSAENGVTVLRYTQKGSVKVVEYRFWWFLKDYETRNKTRDEVFARIALGLAHEDMSGIEVTLG